MGTAPNGPIPDGLKLQSMDLVAGYNDLRAMCRILVDRLGGEVTIRRSEVEEARYAALILHEHGDAIDIRLPTEEEQKRTDTVLMGVKAN